MVRVAADGEVQVQTMRWGLVPSFTKKDEKPDFWRMFNARSESVAEKPSFRRLVPTRRCLVLVEGFYEWQKEKGGAKQPYYIHLAPTSSGTSGNDAAAGDASGNGSASAGAGDGKQGGKEQESEPFVMAGLYDVWDGPEGPMYTYTILTTDSGKRLEWLHDRMPVILRTQQAQQAWLHMGEKELGKLLHLCVPYNGEDLVWHPVTRQMNTPSFQGPECCLEVKKPKVQDFFKPRSAPAASPTEKQLPHVPSPAALKQEPAAGRGSSQEPQQAAAAAAASDTPAAAAGEDTAGGADSVKAEHGFKKESGSVRSGQQQGAAPAQDAAPAAVNTDERPEEPGSVSTGQTNSSQAAAGEAQGGGQKQQEGQQQQRQQAKEAASQATGQKRKQAAGGSGGSAGKRGAEIGRAHV